MGLYIMHVRREGFHAAEDRSSPINDDDLDPIDASMPLALALRILHDMTYHTPKLKAGRRSLLHEN